MPELPEVETIARGLAKRISGDVIESVWLGSKPEPLKSSAAEIAATLQARRISTVRRAGKHIVFDLESAGGRNTPAQWIVHLGMTGSLLVCAPELELEKHTHAVLQLSSGRELRFVDPRRFGRLSVIERFEATGAEVLVRPGFHQQDICGLAVAHTIDSGHVNIADDVVSESGVLPNLLPHFAQ